MTDGAALLVAAGRLPLGLALAEPPPPPIPMMAGSMNRISAAIPSAPAKSAIRGMPRIDEPLLIVGYVSIRCIRSHDGPATVSRVELTDGRLPVRIEGGYGSLERTTGCGGGAAWSGAEADAAPAAAASPAARTESSAEAAAPDAPDVPAGVGPWADGRGWTSPARSSSGAVETCPPPEADQAAPAATSPAARRSAGLPARPWPSAGRCAGGCPDIELPPDGVPGPAACADKAAAVAPTVAHGGGAAQSRGGLRWIDSSPSGGVSSPSGSRPAGHGSGAGTDQSAYRS